jgi:hypothetical protein
MRTQILAAVGFIGIAALLVLGFAGALHPAFMVGFSLSALGLFYGFALWTVIVNTSEPDRRGPGTVRRGR